MKNVAITLDGKTDFVQRVVVLLLNYLLAQMAGLHF
jgi:hypothetical protein